MEQKDAIKAVLSAVVLAASFLLWGFFLNASGITIQKLVEFEELERLFSSLTSLNFILFLIFFSASYALVVGLAMVLPKRVLQAVAVVSFAASAAALLFLFPVLNGFFVAGIFYLVSLAVVAQTTFMKFEEVKSFVFPRVALSAVSQGLTIVGAGLFISTALLVLPIQGQIVKNFEEKLFEKITPSELKDDITKTTVTLITQAQTQIVGQIIAIPSFQKLSAKTDPDSAEFVLTMNALNEKLQSPEYAQELLEKAQQAQAQNPNQMDISGIIEKTKEKLPLFAVAEKFFWLFAAFGVSSIFFIVSTFVLKPLGALLGVLFLTLAAMISPNNGAEQNGPTAQDEEN